MHSRVEPAIFDFHSGFWINLHHFLYEQARLRAGLSIFNVERPTAPYIARTEGLTPAEQRDWEAALGYYVSALAKRDLLFDEEMRNTKNRLEDLESESSLSASGLPAELVAALEKAAPIYRARWWPEHDRANRAWIDRVKPMVAKFAGPLTKQLAAAYHTTWPNAAVRVDVTEYANWSGAYTSLDPSRITISNNEPRQAGYAAFETIFHEASHVLIDVVRDAISRECHAQNKPVPRDLWHAMLFYTTGELVRKRLAEEGVSDYVPYAYKNGLFTGTWAKFRPTLEQHWQAYLDGRTDFDAALKQVVADI